MNKPILAIGTSGKLCSVSILLNQNDYITYNYNKNQVHSEKLIVMVDSVLRETKLKLSDLEAIAVSIGPGSFTGLRIGLSAAKGLALGAELPLIPVNEFNAMAVQVNSYLKPNEVFNFAIKVNSDEVYFAKYKKEEEYFKQLSEIEVIKVKEIADKISTDEVIFGNIKYPNISPLNGVSSEYIAIWASLFGKDLLTYNFDYLEPNYIKNFTVR